MRNQSLHSRWRRVFGALTGGVVMFALATGLAARQQTSEPDGQAQQDPAPDVQPRRFVTHKSGRFGGRDVRYVATAGETFLRDAKGTPRASIFSFAYVEEDAEAARRPVTFVWNGGPGSSSIWLHMGAFGPKRIVVPSDATSAGPAPYRIEPNTESILEVTDLVIVDAIGTGFSRALGEHEDDEFWGLDEDGDSFADFIIEWLTENRRWNSPKYLAGESFGTTRAAVVAAKLQAEGVEVNGLVLASQALNFAGSTPQPENITSYITYLPTMAATAWFHGRVPTTGGSLQEFLSEARRFAVNEYAPALLEGTALTAEERSRVAARLAAFTGLDQAYIERSDLRPLASRFLKELLRSKGLAIGRLDSRYAIDEIDDIADQPDDDAADVAIAGPFAAALLDYMAEDLDVSMPFAYRARNDAAIKDWKWRSASDGDYYEPSYVNVAPRLGRAMRRNPALRVLVASGYYDFATPFFDAELTFARYGIVPERVTMTFYESGHMLYVHEPTRQRFLAGVRAFIRGE